MAKWSQALQPLIYVIFGSFFLGMMVLIIDEVNAGREIDLKAVVKSTAKVYIHLFLVTLFSAILVLVLFDFYGGGMLLARQFLSSAKVPEILGKVLGAALPYFSILIPVVVTTLLAFVVPAIVIDRKKVLSACVTNFQILWGASGFVFWIVLLPVLLYVPFLLLRSSRDAFQAYFIPEIGGMVVAASILVLLFVEALQYTAITTFYLLQKGR
ncbi:MAG: hypothetical protein Q8Q08_10515 [Candidatus Omnitrophota bacterium]|nr:hypothetical protein [Candidatus Omnitrophota bacterium]